MKGSWSSNQIRQKFSLQNDFTRFGDGNYEIMKNRSAVSGARWKRSKGIEKRENQQTTARQNKHTKMRKSFT